MSKKPKKTIKRPRRPKPKTEATRPAKEAVQANPEHTMSEREASILQSMNNEITRTSNFSFRCTQCGQCCRDRLDVLLSPFDLHRMSVKLNMTIPDIIKKYMTIYVGDVSRIPLVRLNMRKDNGKCPFLTDENKCGIHDASPSVCYLFPLGRYVSKKEGEDKEEFHYFLQDVPCGERDQVNTVESWTGKDYDRDLERYFAWMDMVEAFSDVSKKMDKHIEAGEIEKTHIDQFYQAMAIQMYIDYEDRCTEDRMLELVKKATEEFKETFAGFC